MAEDVIVTVHNSLDRVEPGSLLSSSVYSQPVSLTFCVKYDLIKELHWKVIFRVSGDI